MKILIFTLCLCAFVPPCLCAADVSTEKEKLLKIQKELRQKKALLQEVAKKEKGVINELDKINRQLNQTQRKVGELGGAINKTQKEIILKKEALIKTYYSLCQKQSQLSHRLRAIYKYRKNGVLDVLCSTSNLSDMSKQVYFMTMIAQADNTLIREIEQRKEMLNCQKQVLQENRKKLSIIQNDYKQEFIVQQKQEKGYQGLLSLVQEEKNLYRQQVAQLNNSSSELTSLIKRLEAQKKAQEKARAAMVAKRKQEGKEPEKIQERSYPEKGTFSGQYLADRLLRDLGNIKIRSLIPLW